MESNTLLEAIGWGPSDLDESGMFVGIELESSNVSFRSFRDEKLIYFENVIKPSDKLKFPKIFETLNPADRLSLNPLRLLIGLMIKGGEFLLGVFGNYKRLNLMESSLEGFNNPSKNVGDFPFDEWLVVIDLNTSSLVSQLDGTPLGVYFKNPKDGKKWFLSFSVFSHVALIEYEKRSEEVGI